MDHRPARIGARHLALPACLAASLWLGWWLAKPITSANVVSAEMRREAARDTAWQPLDDRTLAGWSGPYQLRFRLSMDSLPSGAPLALVVAAYASSELTWNGQPIGSNGRVGVRPGDESPGAIDWIVGLPPRSDTGSVQVLHVRASSHHVGFSPQLAGFRIAVAPLSELISARSRRWLLPVVALGCVFAAWLYIAAVLPRAGPRRSARLLLALGLVGLLLPIAEAWRPLVGYQYDMHIVRLWTILGLTALTAILLPWYLSSRFAVLPSRLVRLSYALVVAALAILVPGFDGATLLLHAIGLVTGIAVSVAAGRGRRGDRDALLIGSLLGTALVALVAAPFEYLDGLYCIALASVMVVILLRHASFLSELAGRAAELEAVRVRLNTALLRSSIHPHWLMNTLTSLQELIERSPGRASRMVELLADEFRILREISNGQLISAAQEVALCRTHLAIVGLAHDSLLQLDVAGEETLQGVMLPPGVLHTLVENGLTHGGRRGFASDPPERRHQFRLTAVRHGAELCLEMVTPLAGNPERAAAVIPGTGTRFITTSLESAFPGCWRFAQCADAGGWRTSIVIPAKAGFDPSHRDERHPVESACAS